MSEKPELSAQRSAGFLPLLTGLILTALLARFLAHLAAVLDWAHGEAATFWAVFAVLFVIMCVQLVLATLEKPIRATPDEQTRLDALTVAVLVPAYNEDPDALHDCLAGLLAQTRAPQTICVIDDGSNADYTHVRSAFESEAVARGIGTVWIRQANAGKRHAQAAAVVRCPEADVFVTVDSDSVCDRHALAEALKPLKDDAVAAVAGVVMAANARKNTLTRMLDLTWTTWQYTERSALSTLGSVMINSGGFSLYRADIVRDNLGSYLDERFFGRPISFSDDSQLTLYALLAGRVVQQPSAFCFTLVPERVNHHLRQSVRWMRGSAVRSVWRVRYLPLSSVIFWWQVSLWARLLIAPLILLALLANPDTRGHVWPAVVVIPVLLGYIQGLRYFGVRTSTLSTAERAAVYVLLVPVATLWSFTALRLVRWYGIATCARSEWGTRTAVEVTAADAA